MEYKVNFVEDTEYRSFIKHKLRSFNDIFSPYHVKSRKEGYFSYFDIRLDEEKKGGLVGMIYWNLMEIEDMYLSQSHRSQGYGTELLFKAIDIAHEKKLNYILLRTYSFQAKDFFYKHGFRVVGEITDYPPGESFYIMTLVLNYSKKR